MEQDMVQVPGKPGQFYIPSTGRVQKVFELYEEDIYDSVQVPTGLQSNGNKIDFFSDMANKKEQHTNVKTAARLPSHWKMKLTRIGFAVRQLYAATPTVFADTLKIYEAYALDFKLGTRQIAKGPCVKYQSGYGITGVSTESDSTVLNSGVPSQAAAPKLAETQDIDDQTDINVSLIFGGATWQTVTTAPTLSSTVIGTCYLHGIIAKPVGT